MLELRPRMIWLAALTALWGMRSAVQVIAAEGSFVYESKGRRDPFVPLVRNGRILGAPRSPEAVPVLHPILYGILWDPDGKSIALINDQEVSEGDAVGAFRVENILEHSVVLAREGGEQIVLELAFESAKDEVDSAP